MSRTIPLLVAVALLSAAGLRAGTRAAVPATPATAGSKPARPYTRNVAIVLYEGVELLDFAGPGEVFQAAGGFAAYRDQPGFKVYTVATTAKPITSQRFVQVVPNYPIAEAPRPDIIVIPGGNSSNLLQDATFMAWATQATHDAELTLTVCSGAFVPAKMGLLDGATATTWYGAIESLRTAAPKTTVQSGRRFVDNGAIITTAGVSAGIDGALHTVARLAGRAVADRTARYMEYHWTPEPYLAQDYAYLNPSLDAVGRAAQQAELLAEEKDFAGAAQAFRDLTAKSPDDGYLWGRLAYVLHVGGQLEPAIDANQRALRATGPASVRVGALYDLACIYSVRGRTDDALRSLEEAIAAGFDNRRSLLIDPELEAVRSDERFKKLVASL
jgi:putative intracellular protease/amidase